MRVGLARLWIVAALAAAIAILAFPRLAHAQLLSPGPLSKAHASIEGDQHCSDCHSSGKRVDQNACLKCHADLGARIAAGQGLHGLQYKGKPCESCHVEHLGGKALTPWPGGDPSKLDHALTGWPLNGGHHAVTCNKCHNKPNARGASSYLTAQTACLSCHKDQHEGRFDKGCTSCHKETSWKDLDLKSFNHDLSHFPLHGAHQTVQCAKCHAEPPKYAGLKFQACTDCHKDPHAGKLGQGCQDCHTEAAWKPASFKHGAARHPVLSLANGHAAVACATCHDRGNLAAPSKGSECVSCHHPVHKAPLGRACATCHASIQWLGLPRAIGLATHAHTDYPLAGKHESVNCAGCHKPEVPRDARFRKLAFARCADCHQDQHKGEFARRSGGECAPCHATAGFYPTSFSVAIHASTSFPLVGKHGAAPCLSCHKAARPRMDLHIAAQACVDCHENPHGTQFGKEMAQGGCAHCHEATGWKLPKIDHSTWPLTGAHATAECDSCHHASAADRQKGSGASYRGVPRACTGCHEDVHLGQFRLSQPVLECDRCHSTRAFKIPDFDHAAIAHYALTGAHAKVECARCHAAANVPGEKPTSRWRLPPSATECSFCHANPHERRTAG